MELLSATFGLAIYIITLAIAKVTSLQPSRRGPTFSYEPPAHVDFSNDTGTVIPCSAHGNPLPVTRWSLADGTPVTEIASLRHVRPDGSLVFPPFRADDYRQDIHFNVYRCLASSALGTIGSRDVHVRGVVKQRYEVEVPDEFVIVGNTAVLRCAAPQNVKEFLTVTSWLEEPTSTIIQPAGSFGGRYLIQPTGDLYIRNVQVSHSQRTYECRTRNRLTGEMMKSSTPGTLIITESTGSVHPRIVDHQSRIVLKQGDTLTLTCAAQAYPIPEYHWFKMEGKRMTTVVAGERILQLDGTLVVYRTTTQDSGTYVCWVNNSIGEEKTHTDVIITVPLSVKVNPPLLKAELEQSAEINCTVYGHPLVSVEWKKDMKTISSDRMKRLSGELLRIAPVRREDKGMYQCFARNDFETAESATELTLGEDRPNLEEKFEERTMEPGLSLSLRCVASGSPLPQITWSLDDAPIPQFRRIRMGDFVTSSGTVLSYVNVTVVKIEDGGEYKCTADNGVGVVSHSARVKVMGPPVVRPMKNITAVAGEIMIIRCPASGYPLERIYWEKDGNRLPVNHRQKVYENGTLEVYHVERSSDDGPYTCVAKNPQGISALNTVHVKVQIKPAIEPFAFLKSLREGQRSSVMCTVGSGDLPIKIEWQKDGMPISSDSGIRINEAADYSSTLLFKSLRLDHRGNYTCVATNDAGTASHTASMVIHVPPRWLMEPSDVSVIKGKGVMMDCQAAGFPKPRTRWTKSTGDIPGDFKAIVSSPHLQVFENGSLSVKQAHVDDAGYYLCQANNGIGQGLSKVVRLNVRIAAYFESKFTAEVARKGHSARLKCHVVGDNPITLNWFKDNYAISPGPDSRFELVESMDSTGIKSDIIIAKADRTDSALYKCSARNEYGDDETKIELVVQEPPDSPGDVQVIEASSRSVKLEWTSPFNGNSPITQYIVLHKDDSSNWHNKPKNSSFPGTDTIASIHGLKPAHMYHFRVLAENRIGKSEPSRSVEILTAEEAPGGPPLKVRATAVNSKTVKITWRAPSKDLQNGKITGYYVGYKVATSKDPYVYKTLDTDVQVKDEVHVSTLKRRTKYAVIVQAFNIKGAGPPSEEIVVETSEFDPPASPQVEIIESTWTTVLLGWTPIVDADNPISGYLIFQRADKDEWQEIKLQGEHSSYKAVHLRCGTRYQFFLRAYNEAGRGDPCEIATTKTEGKAPIPPDKRYAVSPNLTSAVIHLTAWKDGGCSIESFRVRYKPSRAKLWTLPTESVQPDESEYEISNLSSGVEYDLQVIVANTAGVTEMEYVFTTLLNNSAANSAKTVIQKSDGSFFFDLTIIIPVVISIVVVLAILVIVCAVVRKKRNAHCNCSTDGFPKPVMPDSVQLTELEKVAQSKHVASNLYSSPFATTNFNCDYENCQANEIGYKTFQDEPLYATVKRTPRPPRLDALIYHSPGSTPDPNGQSVLHNSCESDNKSGVNVAKKKSGFLQKHGKRQR